MNSFESKLRNVERRLKKADAVEQSGRPRPKVYVSGEIYDWVLKHRNSDLFKQVRCRLDFHVNMVTILSEYSELVSDFVSVHSEESIEVYCRRRNIRFPKKNPPHI